MKYFAQTSFMLLCLLLSISLMSACGFKLRGALDISTSLSPVYLQANSAFDTAREIRLLLSRNNIAVAEKESSAKSKITLVSETTNRRVLSVDSDGRAREYELNYEIDFVIAFTPGNSSKEKIVEDSLSLKRSLLFDTNAVLAVSNESEVLYKDMRRAAARLILLKLQAHSKHEQFLQSPAIDDVKTEAAQ